MHLPLEKHFNRITVFFILILIPQCKSQCNGTRPTGGTIDYLCFLGSLVAGWKKPDSATEFIKDFTILSTNIDDVLNISAGKGLYLFKMTSISDFPLSTTEPFFSTKEKSGDYTIYKLFAQRESYIHKLKKDRDLVTSTEFILNLQCEFFGETVHRTLAFSLCISPGNPNPPKVEKLTKITYPLKLLSQSENVFHFTVPENHKPLNSSVSVLEFSLSDGDSWVGNSDYITKVIAQTSEGNNQAKFPFSWRYDFNSGTILIYQNNSLDFENQPHLYTNFTIIDSCRLENCDSSGRFQIHIHSFDLPEEPYIIKEDFTSTVNNSPENLTNQTICEFTIFDPDLPSSINYYVNLDGLEIKYPSHKCDPDYPIDQILEYRLSRINFTSSAILVSGNFTENQSCVFDFIVSNNNGSKWNFSCLTSFRPPTSKMSGNYIHPGNRDFLFYSLYFSTLLIFLI